MERSNFVAKLKGMQTINYECRSTVGVLIGCINVVGFSATSIYVAKVLCDFGQLSDDDIQSNRDVIYRTVTLLYIILVVCIIAILVSGLLIVGIIKKRHLLMMPWLFCAAAGIACHTFRLIVGTFSGFLSVAPAGDVVLAVIKGLLALGLQLLIFYVIFKLYLIIRDRRRETQYVPDREEPISSTMNDNPPSYADLEKRGQLHE